MMDEFRVRRLQHWPAQKSLKSGPAKIRRARAFKKVFTTTSILTLKNASKIFYVINRRNSSTYILFFESIDFSILNKSKQENFHSKVLLPGKYTDFNDICPGRAVSCGAAGSRRILVQPGGNQRAEARDSVRQYTVIWPWVKEMRRIQLMISACIGFNSSFAYIHL